MLWLWMKQCFITKLAPGSQLKFCSGWCVSVKICVPLINKELLCNLEHEIYNKLVYMIRWGRSSVRESVSFATRRSGVRFPSSPPILKYSSPQRTRRTQRNRNYNLRRLGCFAFLCSCLATRALGHKEKIRAETINSG